MSFNGQYVCIYLYIPIRLMKRMVKLNGVIYIQYRTYAANLISVISSEYNDRISLKLKGMSPEQYRTHSQES